MLDLAKAAFVRGLAVFLAATLLVGVLKAGDNSSDITGQLRLDNSFTRCDFFGFRFVKQSNRKESFRVLEGGVFAYQGRQYRVVEFRPDVSVTLLDIDALKRVTLMGINPR